MCIYKLRQKTVRINKYSKVAGYKTNITKLVLFQYTNNELSEREIKKAIQFTIALKIKYVGINLTKEVKDLYTENGMILMKKVEDTNKLKHSPCFWIGRINIIKISILLKGTSIFKAIPVKISMYFSQIQKILTQSELKT